jgi:phosphoglycolate phosphatase-like HAD superfamily hydrolase
MVYFFCDSVMVLFTPNSGSILNERRYFMKSNSVQVVFLDFDGIVIESAIVKKNAYRKMFEIFPDHRKSIETYQKIHGGLPRRRQFQEIYSQILGQDLSTKQLDELVGRYVELMLKGVLEAPFVPGAEKFLRDFHQRVELYLVSATPDEELRYIVRERGLERYFRKIYGSPPAKAEILEAILRETGYRPDEAVFVGDYPSDREAAEEVGLPFIARLGSAQEMENCENKIHDLTELSGQLNEMFSL